MKFLEWLRPGIGVKRWILFAVLGIMLFLVGLSLIHI